METLKHINTSLPWTERIWKQLIQAEKPANSILFFGKQGLGKTNTALRYASEILVANDVFVSANHPDLHVIMPENEAETNLANINLDSELQHSELYPAELLSIYAQRYLEQSSAKAKKVISIQQIRQLIAQVTQHPHLAKNKVIIIHNADKMTINASNALLKTLEEPPRDTIFILIANQIESLPITIRSRCAEFHFRAPDKEIGLQWLEQNGQLKQAESYLMMAGRAPLAAMHLSKQNEIDNLRAIFSAINQLWAQKKSSLELAQELKKHELSSVIKHLKQLFQDILKIKCLQGDTNNVSTEFFYPIQKEWAKKIADTISTEQLFLAIDELKKIDKLSITPVDQQLLLEKTAIQLEKLAFKNADLV